MLTVNTGINSLPNEMLFLIFSHLDSPSTVAKAERVCKTWKAIIDHHPEIWRTHLRAKFPSCVKDLPKEQLKFLLSKPNYEDHLIDTEEESNLQSGLMSGFIEIIPIVGAIYKMFYLKIQDV